MSNHEEWNEFMENLFGNALKDYQDTNEYKFLREKREQLDNQIIEKYPDDKQAFYEKFAFEMALDEERKTEFVYRKGLKDCVFILKELGILV